MNKCLLTLFAVSILIYSVVPVYAHPGDTDSDGGHYDYDAGEYHYHHGYTAHDHYDMDSDGDIDCPYDFDDQTGIRSGSSSSSDSSSSYSKLTYSDGYDAGYERGYKYGYRDGEKQASAKLNEEHENKLKEAEKTARTSTFIGTLIPCVLFSAFLILQQSRKKSEVTDALKQARSDLDAAKRAYESELRKVKEEETTAERYWKSVAEQSIKRAEGLVAIRENEMAELRNKIKSIQSEKDALLQKYPYEKTAPAEPMADPIQIPEDVYFVRGTIPVKGEVTSWEPFGDYTVFISQRGKRYHTDRYCGSSFSLAAAHLYDVLDVKTACAKCATEYSCRFPKTVPLWYKRVCSLAANPSSQDQGQPSIEQEETP